MTSVLVDRCACRRARRRLADEMRNLLSAMRWRVLNMVLGISRVCRRLGSRWKRLRSGRRGGDFDIGDHMSFDVIRRHTVTRVWEEDCNHQRMPTNKQCLRPERTILKRQSSRVLINTLTTPSTTAPGGLCSVTATDKPTKVEAILAVEGAGEGGSPKP